MDRVVNFGVDESLYVRGLRDSVVIVVSRVMPLVSAAYSIESRVA